MEKMKDFCLKIDPSKIFMDDKKKKYSKNLKFCNLNNFLNEYDLWVSHISKWCPVNAESGYYMIIWFLPLLLKILN